MLLADAEKAAGADHDVLLAVGTFDHALDVAKLVPLRVIEVPPAAVAVALWPPAVQLSRAGFALHPQSRRAPAADPAADSQPPWARPARSARSAGSRPAPERSGGSPPAAPRPAAVPVGPGPAAAAAAAQPAPAAGGGSPAPAAEPLPSRRPDAAYGR